MTIDYRARITDLVAAGLVPATSRCVFAAGSLVRGWGNSSSDVDVYVVSDEEWRSDTAVYTSVGLEPATVVGESTRLDGVAWDLHYWLDSQVDQVMAKVSWEAYEAGGNAGSRLASPEIALLERFGHGVDGLGGDWLSARRKALADSAFAVIRVSYELMYADSYAEDAVGQLACDDLHSAVLSARTAFGHAMDALLAHHGEYNHNPKWRARRFQAANPTLLSYEDYWALETMRSYDPADPAAWVIEALRACRQVSLEVSV
ncbi:MAG TPA: hypothetical protein VFW65_03455 [Pseudonocardiaceae bacterium]|nr:hypothetical protein [Pseudonocardiaceae bacterium]